MYRKSLYAALIAACGLMAPPSLWAQGHDAHAGHMAPAHQENPPASTHATASGGSYRSAFEGYRPFQPPEVRGWREANDEVARIGGWKAYAKEAQSGGESKDASNPSADPHAGHKME